MKSKFNVIDVILFTALFAVCFSVIMLLIRDFSTASYKVELTVCIENGPGTPFSGGEAAELCGRQGKIVSDTVAGGKRFVAISFESTRAASMPKAGEEIVFTTKRVRAEGEVYSVTETEEDKE